MIAFRNLAKIKIDGKVLRRVAKIVLKGENREKEKEISVVLVTKKEIQKINKKHRGKDSPTDVLSFEGGKDSLGEIVICPAEVKRNAKDFEKELVFVLIHGILHLLGYDHEKDNLEAGKMEKKEKDYLSKIFS